MQSAHLADDGSTENALHADEKTLAKRKVQFLDIWSPQDPATKDDPKLDTATIAAVKAGRGPMKEGWQKMTTPLMCCYKLIHIKFAVFGVQGRAESLIEQAQRDVFMKVFKQIYCMMDQWWGLTLEDIRAIEEQTKRDLDAKIARLNLETKSKGASAVNLPSKFPPHDMTEGAPAPMASAQHDRPRGI